MQFKKKDYFEKSNLLELEISSEFKIVEALRKRISSYSKLKSLTEKLSLSFSLEAISQILSGEVSQLFDSDGIHASQNTTTILYLFHSQTGELGISSSQRGQMQINLKSRKGDVFDQWVVKAMQPLLIEDARHDLRFDQEKITPSPAQNNFSEGYGNSPQDSPGQQPTGNVLEEPRIVRSLISVPLMVSDKALGILRMDCPQENYFSSQDMEVLITIGNLGAIAIENAQLHERIEHLVIKDSLTGLYLRKHLLDRLTEEIGRQLTDPSGEKGKNIRKKELSFLMIDLDHFKDYNDQFGHMAGDIVLRNVGMMLADHFSTPGNLVCRYGGEEFCVLLPDCARQKAFSIAEEFRKDRKSTRLNSSH